MHIFRSRARNEEVARDALKDQLRNLRRAEINNTVDMRLAEHNLQLLFKQKLTVNDPRVRAQLNVKQLIEKDTERIIRSRASLQSKLTSLDSSSSTLAELDILPTLISVTKVSTSTVEKANSLIRELDSNTNNQELLEDAILTPCDIESQTSQWENDIASAQVEELETQQMEKQKQRATNIRTK